MATPPGKLDTLLGYLDLGVAMIHLDARRPGVLVPPEHAGEAHLRLNLSRRFNIPDLEVTARGVQATLSFRGRHFQCQLPWSAIFGITSQVTGDGQVWPEDLPGEVAHELSTKAAARTEHPDPPARRLRPVALGEDGPAPPAHERRAQDRSEDDRGETGAAEPEGGKPANPPRRGHLRLVR